MTLDDLLGSLRTYEMNLDVQAKEKGITLKKYLISSKNTPYSEEDIMMLSQNFGELLSLFLTEHQGLKTLLEEKIETKRLVTRGDVRGVLRKNYDLTKNGKGIQCRNM